MKSKRDVDAIKSARERGSLEESLPLVSLQNVSLGYDSAPVVQGVSLAIYPSSLIGLAGPNGSGKTTLFRTILGLLRPLGGTLSRSCSLANFGYVPQSAALDAQFPLSASEVVEMGAYGRVRSYQFLLSKEKERVSITDLLHRLTREEGLAVFFSSHDLEMVQRVADSIVRVDKGQIWLEERKARLQP